MVQVVIQWGRRGMEVYRERWWELRLGKEIKERKGQGWYVRLRGLLGIMLRLWKRQFWGVESPVLCLEGER